MRCAELLKQRLTDFNVSFDDIVGLTTDGASVMLKMGRTLPFYHQLCYAHGLQLAILDVLYKKDRKEVVLIPEEVFDSDSEDDDDSFTVEHENMRVEITNSTYKQVICKVRKVVKLFKKSATK